MLDTNILFVSQIIIDFTTPFVQNWFKSEEIGLYEIICFTIMLIISELINLAYIKATVYESQISRINFFEDSLKQYSRLSQSDRESEEVSSFKRIVRDKEQAVGIKSWFKLSYKVGISLFVSLLSTVWIINSVLPLVYILVCYYISYNILQKEMKKARDLRTEFKNIEKKYSKMNDFQMQKLRIGKGNISSIIDRRQELSKMIMNMEYQWNKLSILCSMPIIISVFLSLLTCEANHINLVMFCMVMLKSTEFITKFCNSYYESRTKHEKYDEYWNNKSYTIFPKQIHIPNVVRIMEYSFNGNLMVFANGGEPLCIERGKTYRLTGSTGSGKTSFINALKGAQDGIILDVNSTKNYHKFISHLRQDIRSAYYFSEITLSEMFESVSEKYIKKMLRVVGLTEWFEKIMDGNIYKDINNNISGGQRTMLCMALTIVEGIHSQMIIMDEPEQGLDTELIPELFESVFSWLRKNNPDLIIIFVSHVCDCVVRKLPEHTHWHIENEDGVRIMYVE